MSPEESANILEKKISGKKYEVSQSDLSTFTSGLILLSAPFKISKQDSCSKPRKIFVRAISARSSLILVSSAFKDIFTSFETAS